MKSETFSRQFLATAGSSLAALPLAALLAASTHAKESQYAVEDDAIVMCPGLKECPTIPKTAAAVKMDFKAARG